MAEYIKKEILIEKLLQSAEDFEKSGGFMQAIFATGLKALVDVFNDKECCFFEEIEPVAHAHWVWTGVLEEKMFICSHCGECAHYDGTTWWTDPFCWNCGAQMGEEE